MPYSRYTNYNSPLGRKLAKDEFGEMYEREPKYKLIITENEYAATITSDTALGLKGNARSLVSDIRALTKVSEEKEA